MGMPAGSTDMQEARTTARSHFFLLCPHFTRLTA